MASHGNVLPGQPAGPRPGVPAAPESQPASDRNERNDRGDAYEVNDVPAAVLASQELRTFRSAWEEAPLGLCLLVDTDNGQRKRWFSPEFGLVREELAGTRTRDLVYSR